METTINNKQNNKSYANGKADHVSASIGEEQKISNAKADPKSLSQPDWKASTSVTPESSYKSQPDSDFAARFDTWKESAAGGYDVAIDTVKKYPLYTILGAAGIGLLAGTLLARRKN